MSSPTKEFNDFSAREFYQHYKKFSADGSFQAAQRMAQDLADQGFLGMLSLYRNQVAGYPCLFRHIFYTCKKGTAAHQHFARIAQVAVKNLKMAYSPSPSEVIEGFSTKHHGIFSSQWYLPLAGTMVYGLRQWRFPIGVFAKFALESLEERDDGVQLEGQAAARHWAEDVARGA